MIIEDMTSDEKIDYIKERIPEDVHSVFTKEWDYFIDSCSQNSSEFLEDEEDFDKFFEIFMTYPH